MRQRIRFCATPAGRVAYSVMGAGPVLLGDTSWVSHLEQIREIESVRAFFAALSEHFSVVRFDKVGSGLSDQTGVDLALRAWHGEIDPSLRMVGRRRSRDAVAL